MTDVSLAPVGADLTEPDHWQPIGHLIDAPTLAADSDWLLGCDPAAGQEPEDTPLALTQRSTSVTFTITPEVDRSPWWDLIGGEPAPGVMRSPTRAVLIVYKVPFHDVPPRKRRGLTGKAYRIARRRFRRQRQAWVRAGRPMLDQHVYLPRARIESVADTSADRVKVSSCP